MELLAQLTENGIILGLLYGLMAYGISLIVSTTGVWHFAQGATVVVAAYTFWTASQAMELHWIVAVLIAAAVAGVAGVLMELAVYRPLRKHDASLTVVLVASLALFTLGQNLVQLVWGTTPRVIPGSETLAWTTTVGPVIIRAWDLIVIAASALVFAALHLLQTRTRLGLSFRALGDNPTRAETLGIHVERTYVWAFFVGSLVAVGPAVLLAVQTPLTTAMGFDLLLKAIVALVIGGVGSMPGALFGGVLIGVVENVAVFRLPTEWAEFILFIVLFAVVLARPEGLLTRKAGV